jgi:dihydroneopterin aldolase
MAIIRLQGLDFFSHHGVYEEERKIGNRYTVDVEVVIAQNDFSTDMLNETVNYEEIYLTVATVMSAPVKLLETIASTINQQLLHHFSSILSIQTTVSKHNPPIKGVCDRASVTILLER